MTTGHRVASAVRSLPAARPGDRDEPARVTGVRRWTDAEDGRLREMYAQAAPVAAIATALGRTPDAVVARRRALGVPPARITSHWSAREDMFLRAGTASGLPAGVLAERLGRTLNDVRRRRRRLGLGRAGGRPYGAREDQAIRMLWTTGGDLDALAGRLGRSPDALRLRAQQLGVHRPAARRRWTPSEDATVRDGYAEGRSCAAIAARLPGRTAEGVAARARKLGLITFARPWSATDDIRLRHLLAVRSPVEVARAMGRTPEAVRRRARSLAIRPTVAPAPRHSGARWTAEEDELLRLHVGLNPANLAEMLGRSDRAVARRLAKLGLRVGRERSPHHVAPRDGEFTPGERALIGRELRTATPAGVVALARRLGRSPGAIRRVQLPRAAAS